MAASSIISLGIGSPASIPLFLTLGLGIGSPGPEPEPEPPEALNRHTPSGGVINSPYRYMQGATKYKSTARPARGPRGGFYG